MPQSSDEVVRQARERRQEQIADYAHRAARKIQAKLKGGRPLEATLAAGIIAKMGVDMNVFGNVSQLASWTGVCPGIFLSLVELFFPTNGRLGHPQRRAVM
jgi:hypothetical protein